MGRKLGAMPLWEEGTGSPSNTIWPGPRPTRTPSFILIRQTVWPQYTNVTDRTDRQLSDSIGRIILQTVAQNSWTDRDAVWCVDSGWLKEPCVRWGTNPYAKG